MKIGFVGTGIMGRPMAGHLQKAGHQLFLVRNRTPLPEELIAGGAIECSAPEEVARNAETVILMLPDTPHVERVLFGAGGLASGLRGGSTVIDMSSIDPLATRRFAERVREAGCEYLDAPVSGGEIGAKNQTLTIMVGGSHQAYDAALPILGVLGKNIVRVGDVGSGQVAKVANQIIVALNIAAVAEGLLFAARAGVDPAKVREALLGGFASSRVLEVHGERMIDRNFAPGFRIGLHQKDLRLALHGALELGLALPLTASVQQLLSGCRALGCADWDHSAIVKALEALSGIELGRPNAS